MRTPKFLKFLVRFSLFTSPFYFFSIMSDIVIIRMIGSFSVGIAYAITFFYYAVNESKKINFKDMKELTKFVNFVMARNHNVMVLKEKDIKRDIKKFEK